MSLRAVPSVIGLVVLCAALCGTVPASRADAPPEPAPFAGSYAGWQALVPPGDAPDGLSVHVLLEEYAVTFDADGRRTMRWRLVFQPLTKAQVDAWGTVSEEWGLWYQERPELRGRVLAPDGSVHEIDPATIGERPAERDERVLDDRRVVEAPLPGLVTGAIVEQQTTVRDRVPFFDRGMARRVSFGRGVPVRRVRVVLDRPAAMPFRVGVRRFEAQPVERVEGGRAITTLEAGPLVGNADPELNLTYVESIVPSVWFSNGTSWGEVAARYGEIVDRRAAGELPAALRKAVAEPGTPRERAQRALDWVHGNVRYTGIEFGESAIEPRPPAETARTKFGDCKDQATLLVAALRSVKLDARVALLAPGRGPDVEPDFPGLGGFDHAIVYVGGASPFWIDPTDPFSRAGELPLADAGRLALVTGAGTTALTPTPSPSVEDSRETSRRSVTLQFGKGRVAETIEGSGWIEHALRGWIDGRSPDDRTKLLEAYVQDTFRADVLKSGQSGDPRSFAKPMTVTTESADVRSALVDETEGAVAFSLRPLFEYAPEALRTAPPEKPVPLRAWQRRPEVTAYRVAQHAKEWVWDIVPPRGFVVRELPAGAVDEVPGMRLVREYATTPEGHVRARLRFELRQERLLPAEARAIRDAIVKYAQETVVLAFDHEGYRHLGAGRIKEAIASFRRLVADDAKDTRAHCGLAQAYLQGGMGELARREIDAAIATAPGFATAHRVRGWILEHDLIGRRFAKGFDDDGAVAAYRKAEELDPTDLVARVSRAILLEHDRHGRRYTAEARLDDAIAAYRAPAGQQNTTQVKVNQAFAECYAGRFKDARETLLSVPAAERPQELRLAIDATADLAKTLAEIRREQDPQKRANLAHQAAMHLVRFRQYAPAAELMSEAGRGVPEASARLGLADLLRRTTPRAPTKLDAPDMAEFMRHAVQQLLSMDVERIAPLFPPELGEDINAERGFRSMGADLAVAEQAFGYEATRDIAAVGMRLRSDAIGADGARATAESMDGKSFVLYLARRNGRWSMLGMPGEAPGVTIEVLRLLDAGNVDGARAWLDAVREDVTATRDEDPLNVNSFAVLWPKKNTLGADAMRRAALALGTANRKLAPRAVELFEAARNAAATPDERAAIERALLAQRFVLKDWPALEAQFARLLADYPDSELAFRAALDMYRVRHMWKDVERLSGARLAAKPDDRVAKYNLGSVAGQQEHYDEAIRILDELTHGGKAEPQELNALAWTLAGAGRDLDRAAEIAQRAVGMAPRREGILHTLAFVRAERGESGPAREVALDGMKYGNDDEPSPSWWLVLGRIAENYGVPEAAVAAYERVLAAPDAEADALLAPLARRGIARARPVPAPGAPGATGTAGKTGVPGAAGKTGAAGAKGKGR